MRSLDVIVGVLLVIGGLNWGLIGFFQVNLIEMIFGEMTGPTRLIYSVVGICALYQIFQWQAIQKRWTKKRK